MPLPSWKSVLWHDSDMTYSATKPDDERQHVKTENQMNTKFIVILVVTAFFAVSIVCLLVAILYKWLQNRRQDKAKEKLASPAKKPIPYSPQPRHMKLMRSDSSLSEIVDTSRESSLPPTPLSPLSEEDNLSFPFERGRLEFSIFYDRDKECLKTSIIQAHGLPQRSCIFYVEGTLLPDVTTQQKTSIRYHNPSPVFEESMNFSLPFEELSERTLCLKVVELDGFSNKLPVGHLLYSFDTENNNYMDMLRMDQELSRGRPQVAETSRSFFCLFKQLIKYIVLVLFEDNYENSNIGEILVSLCYLPTAGRLTLVVLKSRLFQASNGLPSTFLKVSLMLNRKQVKKIKTSIKSKTLTPIYNEAFIFDVPAQHIGNVGLYARVVNDRDNQELLGKVVIGPNARTSMGIHHWECMLLSPRKPIAQWHKIL